MNAGYKETNPKHNNGEKKPNVMPSLEPVALYDAMANMEGQLKYGECNYIALGSSVNVYLKACMRHLIAFTAGQWAAPDTTVPHLASARRCLAIILLGFVHKNIEDDRPPAYDIDAVNGDVAKIQKRLQEMFGSVNPVHYNNANSGTPGSIQLDTTMPEYLRANSSVQQSLPLDSAGAVKRVLASEVLKGTLQELEAANHTARTTIEALQLRLQIAAEDAQRMQHRYEDLEESRDGLMRGSNHAEAELRKQLDESERELSSTTAEMQDTINRLAVISERRAKDNKAIRRTLNLTRGTVESQGRMLDLCKDEKRILAERVTELEAELLSLK